MRVRGKDIHNRALTFEKSIFLSSDSNYLGNFSSFCMKEKNTRLFALQLVDNRFHTEEILARQRQRAFSEEEKLRSIVARKYNHR